MDLVAHEDAALLLAKQAGKVDRRLDVPERLAAPLLAGESVGRAVFTLAGETVFELDLYPAADVISKSLGAILRRIGAEYLRRGEAGDS